VVRLSALRTSCL